MKIDNKNTVDTLSYMAQNNRAIVEKEKNPAINLDAVKVVQPDSSKALAKYRAEMMHVENYIINANESAKIRAAVDANAAYSNQKILELSNLGLHIASGDYYIIPYGSVPKFELDYKGMLKAASMAAERNGFIMAAKADTLRDGFTRFDLTTRGLVDDVVIENGKINGDVLTAYAIITLVNRSTGEVFLQKVEVLPIDEYKAAITKSKMSTSGPHKEFKTEMAKKIALRRAVKIIGTMFPSDVLDAIFNLDNESYSFEESEDKESTKKIGDKL